MCILLSLGWIGSISIILISQVMQEVSSKTRFRTLKGKIAHICKVIILH